MATYVVLNDDPYSNRSQARGFGYAGLLAGAVGLTGWTAMHGYLPGLRPADAFGQLVIVAMAWVGGGLFAVMAICAWVAIDRSAKSRGTITVDEVGVLRRIRKRTQTLRWKEIEGIVTMGQEGATLVPREDGQGIWIPGSLDDLRGCIAEITAKGIAYLPSDRLNSDSSSPRRKVAWWKWLLTYAAFAFLLSRSTPASHAGKIAEGGYWVGLIVWLVMVDRRREGQRWLDRFSLSCLFGWVAWVAYHTAHIW
jgi:hypothetical protein